MSRRTTQRYRHQRFSRALDFVETVVPAGRVVRAAMDIRAAHKHPKAWQWLERHPCGVFHFPQRRQKQGS